MDALEIPSVRMPLWSGHAVLKGVFTEEQLGHDLPEGWDPEEEVRKPVLLGPGDVSLHCWHTVHGNPPNRGAKPRRVVAAHFSIGPVEYRRCGQFSHVNERVVQHLDGVPDFGDEMVCPVVWKE